MSWHILNYKIVTFNQFFYAPLEQFEVVSIGSGNLFSFYHITNFFLTMSINYMLTMLLLNGLPKNTNVNNWNWPAVMVLSAFSLVKSQINLSKKREELKDLERRLDGLVSPEQRRELELQEISKLIE